MTSLEYYIEQVKQFISALTDDIESGYGTVVTQTKLAVYREVLKHLEEIEQERSYNSIKTELNGDLISRQAALDKKELVELEDGQSFYCISPEDVETLPPVTPQPKMGHWITKEAYSEDKAMGFTEQIVCSNCDMQNSYFSEWDECKNPISKTFIRSKFCPNCGCRMVEPQERSDKE